MVLVEFYGLESFDTILGWNSLVWTRWLKPSGGSPQWWKKWLSSGKRSDELKREVVWSCFFVWWGREGGEKWETKILLCNRDDPHDLGELIDASTWFKGIDWCIYKYHALLWYLKYWIWARHLVWSICAVQPSRISND